MPNPHEYMADARCPDCVPECAVVDHSTGAITVRHENKCPRIQALKDRHA